MTNFLNLTGRDLLTRYNDAAERLGLKTVNRFSDRKTAERRTAQILADIEIVEQVEAEETAPVETGVTVYDAPVGPVRPGVVRVDEQVAAKKAKPGSRIAALVAYLTDREGGATVDQIADALELASSRHARAAIDSARKAGHEIAHIGQKGSRSFVLVAAE